MSKDLVNKSLERPLKSGKAYDKLIPSSRCESTFLGNGDTYYSIDQISAFIENYHDQVKSLSDKLKKGSLDKTVNSIYNFLYHHLQYKADDIDQLLRSPACSWASREEGIDCKSYSIFAGALLMNLGIKFYVRKIKQPFSAFPDQFTHVYVIVPKDQKKADLSKGYFIIDGTTHNNSEPIFSHKKDVLMSMPHYGLNAPALMPTTANQPISNQAISGFDDFLKFLGKVGVNPYTTNAAWELFNDYLHQGIDPYFQINAKGFQLGNTFFSFFDHTTKRITRPFLLASQVAPEAPNIGVSGGLNAIDPFTLQLIMSAMNGQGGQQSGGGSGIPTGGGDGGQQFQIPEEAGIELQTLASGILDSDFFSSTIGAVLGNGWDLSCWGASSNPRTGKAEAQQDAPHYFAWSGLRDEISANTLNTFIFACNAYMRRRWDVYRQTDRFASCTVKGYKAADAVMRGYRDQVIEDVKRIVMQYGGRLVEDGAPKKFNTFSFPVKSGWAGGTITDDGHHIVEVQFYRIEGAPQSIPNPRGGSDGSGGSSGGYNPTIGSRPTQTTRPTTTSSGGSGGFSRGTQTSRPTTTARPSGSTSQKASLLSSPFSKMVIAGAIVYGITKINKKKSKS